MSAAGFHIGALDGHWSAQPMPPATAADVGAFELAFGDRLQGGRLPAAYRNFLLTANGGCVRGESATYEDLLRFGSNSPNGMVEHWAEVLWTLDLAALKSLTPDPVQFESMSLWHRQKSWLSHGLIEDWEPYYTDLPDDLFPIGEASSESCPTELLVLGIRDQRFGKVFVFRVDRDLWTDEVVDNPEQRLRGEDFVFPVADDFNGFIDALRPGAA